MTPNLHHEPPLPAVESIEDVMSSVERGCRQQTVTLSSGRRYELEAGEEVDRLVVRSASGTVLLRIAVGDQGPLLSFDSAEITLSARNKLKLSAPEVSIDADTLSTTSEERSEVVTGNRHSHVGGEDRLEAAAVAIQANEESVQVRAMDRVALDADHIGLNDMPCPTPFTWSALHEEEAR